MVISSHSPWYSNPQHPVLIHFQQSKEIHQFTLHSFNNVLKRSALLFSFHFNPKRNISSPFLLLSYQIWKALSCCSGTSNTCNFFSPFPSFSSAIHPLSVCHTKIKHYSENWVVIIQLFNIKKDRVIFVGTWMN